MGFLPRRRPLARATFHALPGPHLDQIGLEFGDHGQHVEQESADRIGGVVDRSTEAELDLAGGELRDDVAGVGQRSGKPVELSHDQDVALSGEVLFVGGDPGVADQQSAHRRSVPVDTRSSGISPGGSYGNWRAAVIFTARPGGACPGRGSSVDAVHVAATSVVLRTSLAAGCLGQVVLQHADDQRLLHRRRHPHRSHRALPRRNKTVARDSNMRPVV